MKSKKIILMLLLSTALLVSGGCVAKDNGEIEASNSSSQPAPALPRDNLPQEFKLLAEKTASTQGVNITDEIKDFYGAEDIGPADAVVGIYTWAPLGEGYDSKITLITLQDEAHAQSAISNYKSQPEFQKPPYVGVDRFGKAIVNGHEVTEIRDKARNKEGEKDLRYLYLWNNGNIVILVEGNSDRSQSIELASATGL